MKNEGSDLETVVAPLDAAKVSKFSVAGLLSICGNSHTYQTRLMVLFTIMQTVYSFTYVILPNMFYIPDIFCVNEDQSLRKCLETEACTNPHGYVLDKSRISLVTEFSLLCGRKYLDINGKNFIFFFSGVWCLAISSLSDYFGRKFIFLTSGVTLIIGSVLAMSYDYYKVVFGVALCWLAMELLLNFIQVYSNETVGSKLRCRFMSVIYMGGALGLIIANLESYFFMSYQNHVVVPGVINGLLSLAYFFLAESPYYLAKIEDKPRLLTSLNRINEVNFSHDEKKMLRNANKLKRIINEDETTEGQEPSISETVTVVDVEDDHAEVDDFEISRGRAWFIIMCVCTISANLAIMFSLVSLSLQRFGNKDLHLNGILLVISGSLFLGYSFKYAPAMNRKRVITQHCLVVIFAGIALYALKRLQLLNFWYGMAVDVALTLCITSGAIVVNCLIPSYEAELLPTKYRGMMCGLELFICKISYIVSTYLDYAGQVFDINPMMLCALPTLFSLVAIRLLPAGGHKRQENN